MYVSTHNMVDTKERTLNMCVECNVPLCITPCFRDYHTKKQY